MDIDILPHDVDRDIFMKTIEGYWKHRFHKGIMNRFALEQIPMPKPVVAGHSIPPEKLAEVVEHSVKEGSPHPVKLQEFKFFDRQVFLGICDCGVIVWYVGENFRRFDLRARTFSR